MDNLLTGLNGGNVPALELIFMITLVALLPSIVVMMTSFKNHHYPFFHQKCNGDSADPAQSGVSRDFFVFDPLYYGSCYWTNQ